MARPTKVEITEVGPRDGLQAEANFIPTEAKIRFVNALIAAGTPRIEFSSFVSPKAIPQLSDVVEVFEGIERTNPCKLAALVPNAHGAIRAVEAKVDEMIVFMSASESHNQKNVNRSIDESLNGFERVAQIAAKADIPVHGAIATGFGCPFEGEVSLDTIVKIAKRYQDYGFTGVGLGDTTGMATPPIVTKFVRTLQDAVPEMGIALHFHNTRGIGLVNVVAGLDEGIDKFDASFAGIGGCPFAPKATGNICTEDLVYMLEEMGIKTGIDIRKMMGIACDVEETVGRDLPGQVMKAGLRLDLHDLGEVATAKG